MAGSVITESQYPSTHPRQRSAYAACILRPACGSIASLPARSGRSPRRLLTMIALCIVAIVALRIDGHETTVGLREQRRRDQEVRRGAVTGHRDIPDHGDAQERSHIGIVRVRLQWVPEENEEIDLTLGDLRPDLLIAAQWSALQLVDVDSQLMFEQLATGSGGVQNVLSEQLSIIGCPLQEILLLVVVRDEGDALLLSNGLLLGDSFCHCVFHLSIEAVPLVSDSARALGIAGTVAPT